MKILIVAPVRQKPHIFKEYIESLDRLKIPDGVTVDRAFCFHCCRGLEKFLKPTDIVAYNDEETPYKEDDYLHRWNESALSQVAAMKNELLKQCLDGYDAIFFVDSDLIMHPQTLEVLISRNKPIVSEIFWTRWDGGDPMPNCWDYDHYSFVNNAVRYQKSGLIETGGTGACILIRREVIEAGVNFNPIQNLPLTLWEDRAFCVRAQVMGFPIYVDTTRPCRHLYREADYERYIARKAK